MFDAVVAGAGPAGSTAARLLAEAGWSVLLIEKSIFPRVKVCGEFISATSMPLLTANRVGEAILPLSGPQIRHVGLFAGRTITDAQMPAATDSATPWGRAIRREHLDLLLARAAATAGAEVWQPWKVTALRRDGGGFAVSVASGDLVRDVTARIVIVATGSWERNGMFAVHAPHRSSDLLAFKSHFQRVDLAPDLMPLLIFPGGYGGMVNAGRNGVSLSFCIRRDTLDRCRKLAPGRSAADAALQHIVASCKGVRDALALAEPEGKWLAAGPIRPGMRPRHASGIYYIGNAAGEAHPIIAEGISMAMQSAWLLCNSLLNSNVRPLNGEHLAAAGQDYARRWRRSFSARVRVAAAFAHVAMQPGASMAAPIINKYPQVLRFGARLSGKTIQLVA